MRPQQVVVVTGTGTNVGKTWVAQALIATLTEAGLRIAREKPAQSFAPEETTTDADRLATASGETPTEVCPTHRWYPLALAPPMAASVLGGRCRNEPTLPAKSPSADRRARSTSAWLKARAVWHHRKPATATPPTSAAP
jgi:hypothetical protein